MAADLGVLVAVTTGVCSRQSRNGQWGIKGSGDQKSRAQPIGYRLIPNTNLLEIDAQEQAAIEEICRLRQAGFSLRGIAAHLNDAGHGTRRVPRGGWSP
ncbi:MAG: hypothetical protein ABI995_16360 [Acidobacteriota bacterium]